MLPLYIYIYIRTVLQCWHSHNVGPTQPQKFKCPLTYTAVCLIQLNPDFIHLILTIPSFAHCIGVVGLARHSWLGNEAWKHIHPNPCGFKVQPSSMYWTLNIYQDSTTMNSRIKSNISSSSAGSYEANGITALPNLIKYIGKYTGEKSWKSHEK